MECVSGVLFGKDSVGVGEVVGFGKRVWIRVWLGFGEDDDKQDWDSDWGIGLGIGLSERSWWFLGGVEFVYVLRIIFLNYEDNDRKKLMGLVW